MMTTSTTLLLSVPLLYALGALCLALPDSGERSGFNLARRWRLARLASAVAPLITGLAGLAFVFGPGASVARYSLADALGGADSGWLASLPALSVRADALSLIMLGLVTLVAWIITGFSQRYLDGEPGQLRYLRAFTLTMAAVSLLVVTNSLLVLVVAWSVSSIALHQLLTYYPDRPQALVAAHKKFLMSRVADVSFFAALLLLHYSFGTLELDQLGQRAQQLGQLPAAVEVAGTLLAVGVMLRSAQLPFHGWLIQVMEAPTPVSALLHAGIVNIGGFVLIRLAALYMQLEFAPTLLVLVGGLTATLAALVMTTRVSVKVGLAWSTCAQMGFMLFECGVGAYELALLHLVAHSLYKAHAFLGSGRTVSATVASRAVTASPPPGLLAWVAALACALPLVFGMDALVGAGLGSTASGWAAGFILAGALTPMLVRARPGSAVPAAVVVGVAALTSLGYLGLHALAGLALADLPPAPLDVASLSRLALAVALFAASFALHAALRSAPDGVLARRVYPAVYAGFYLDETFTRLTFALWPPRVNTTAGPASTLGQTPSMGSAA